MKKAVWGSAAYLALLYGTNAIYQGYISKFYQQQGIDGARLTRLLVLFPLMSALAQPLWGRLGDRQGRGRALRLAILGALPPMAMLAGARSYAFMTALVAAFAVCYPAVQPLTESLTLDRLEEKGGRFGPVRLAGCAAFAAASLLTGRLPREDYRLIPVLTAAGLAALLLASPRPEKRKPARTDGGRKNWLAALRLPYMTPLLLLYMPLQLALGFYFSYYALYFTALPGADGRLLGWGLFLGTLSEAPFLMLADRLFDRFGAGRLMLAAALALTLRFWLLSLGGVTMCLLSQPLHGATFAVITFCMAKYAHRAAGEGRRAAAQTLVAAAGYGVPRTLGSLAGRWLPPRTGFVVGAGIALAAFAVFLPVFGRRPPINGKQRPS